MINFFTHSKKFYLYSSFLLIVLIIILGIASPILLKSFEENWNETLEEKLVYIEDKVKIEFAAKEDYLIIKSQEVGNEISSIIHSDFDTSKIFELFDTYAYEQNENVLLINNDNELLAWNENSTSFDFTLLSSNLITFIEFDLRTYLATKKIIDENHSLIFLLPKEKNYFLSNEFYENISFTENLVKKFNTPFQIHYSKDDTLSFDGRNHSFNLTSTEGSKIAVITLRKPSLNSELLSLSDFIITLQLVLTVLLILSASVLYFNFVKSLKGSVLKLSSIMIYFVLLRFILFYLGIPAKFLGNDLINPSYFSSTFAFGIVKSPLEFFISVLFVLLISLSVYNYSLKYISNNNSTSNSWIKFIIAFLICSALYLVTLRGLGATVRSVIYDSSLAFFKGPQLLPNIPTIFMHLSVLMINVAIIIFCLVMLLLIFKNMPIKFSGNKLFAILFLLIVFQVIGYFYDLLQNFPQGTPFLRTIFITISILLFASHIYYPKRTISNYVYFLFFASFFSINLMKHYNSEIERESLKIIANDLNRSNEGIVKFNVDAAISGEVNNPDLINKLQENNSNFDSEAFKILINSGIAKVAKSSFVIIQNETGENLGEVYFPNSTNNRSQYNIFASNSYYSQKKPILMHNEIIGFLVIGGSLESRNIDNSFENNFFTYPNSFSKIALDLDKTSVSVFDNYNLAAQYGDYILNDYNYKLIKNSVSTSSDSYVTMENNDKMFLTYVLKNNSENKIIVVSLHEKDLAWNLYDFFKVFFIHSLLILFVLIAFVVFQISKYKRINFTFRFQLLAAFLIIAIIPLIFLANYFRELTEEKNNYALNYKLGKRAARIEKYVTAYAAASNLELTNIFQKANKDLGIDYSVFRNNKLIYTSSENFYNVGLLPNLLNPNTYIQLNILNNKEHVIEEKVENYVFTSFYYKSEILGDEYIIKANNAFNNILLPMSAIELDTFLFGSYSLAVILIVIVSTMMASQISQPIRKLTNATKSLASGDLNVQVEENYQGEVKDLVHGFNNMVSELKKNQVAITDLEREMAWKEMARQVAHEIKNPLTPMRLAIQQLIAVYDDKSKKFDEVFKKVTGTVIGQIDTLTNIASEFSAFARMPNIKMEEISIQKIVRNVCDLFIEEKIKIKVENINESLTVTADKDQLNRVFINLIRNSIQASAKNIIISYEQNEDNYFIFIKDDGKGINPNIANRIFDKNFTTKNRGMGLGLNMAKSFMNSIGGSIELIETSEKGTTLQLKFNK